MKKNNKKKKEKWVNPFIYNPIDKKKRKKEPFIIDPLKEPVPLTPPIIDSDEDKEEQTSFKQPPNFNDNQFIK
jgi:hypothetical protein